MNRQGITLLLRLAYRNVLRNPRRSFLTLSAIAVGILSSNMLAALVAGMGEQMIRDAIRNLTGHIQIHAPEYLDDPVVEHSMPPPAVALEELLNEDEVKKWSVRVRVPGVVMSERESAGVTLVGIEPDRERGLSFIGDGVGAGRFLNSAEDSGVLMGRKLVEFLRTDLNKRVVLMSQHAEEGVADRGFRVVGVFDAELESTEKAYVFVGKKTLQKMLGMGEEISEIALLGEDRENLQGLVGELHAATGKLKVSPWTELEPLIMAMVEIQGGFMYIWYVIVIIAVAFGLVNTLFMAIYERVREFGLYQALGMKQEMIMYQVLFESLVLLLAGAIVGNLLTAGLLWLLADGIDLSMFAMGAEMFGMSSMIYPQMGLRDLLAVNILVAVIGLLSSLYPAWRASRLVPVEAITRGQTG